MLWRSLNRQLAAGRVIGFTDTDVLETEEGPTLTLEMTGRLYDDGEVDVNDWTMYGEPTVTVSTPAVPSDVTTRTALVNRIPDVVNAPAGLVTIDQLSADALPAAATRAGHRARGAGSHGLINIILNGDEPWHSG